MALIVTEQAPSAKPVSVMKFVTDVFEDIIEVDRYEVPVAGFAAETREAPGVVEVTSPVTVANTSQSEHTFDLRFVRDEVPFIIANDIVVPPNEIVYIPLNGQFFRSQTDDKLQIRGSTGGVLTVLISFTQGQAEEDSPFI